MAIHRIPILVSPNALNVEQSLLDMVANAQAAGDSMAATKDIVRDGNGKIVTVFLEHNGASPQAALDATASNPSVLTFGPSLPPPCFTLDITNIAYTSTLRATTLGRSSGDEMLVKAIDASGTGFAPGLGKIQSLSASQSGGPANNVYTDFGNNPLPATLTHSIIKFICQENTGFTVAPSSITITKDGSPLVLANVAPIVVPAFSAGNAGELSYWIDAAGKMYLHDPTPAFPAPVSYADAVAAGPV